MIHDRSAIHPAVEAIRSAVSEAVGICNGAGVMKTSGLLTELTDIHQRVVELQRDLTNTLDRPDVMKQPPKLPPGRALPDIALDMLQPYCNGIQPKDLLFEIQNVGRLGPAMIAKVAELQRSKRIKSGLYKHLVDLAEVEGTEIVQ